MMISSSEVSSSTTVPIKLWLLKRIWRTDQGVAEVVKFHGDWNHPDRDGLDRI